MESGWAAVGPFFAVSMLLMRCRDVRHPRKRSRECVPLCLPCLLCLGPGQPLARGLLLVPGKSGSCGTGVSSRAVFHANPNKVGVDLRLSGPVCLVRTLRSEKVFRQEKAGWLRPSVVSYHLQKALSLLFVACVPLVLLPPSIVDIKDFRTLLGMTRDGSTG